MPKNIVNMNIKIDKSLKEQFIKLCIENDTDASKELRRHIKSYISKKSTKTI